MWATEGSWTVNHIYFCQGFKSFKLHPSIDILVPMYLETTKLFFFWKKTVNCYMACDNKYFKLYGICMVNVSLHSTQLIKSSPQMWKGLFVNVKVPWVNHTHNVLDFFTWESHFYINLYKKSPRKKFQINALGPSPHILNNVIYAFIITSLGISHWIK